MQNLLVSIESSALLFEAIWKEKAIVRELEHFANLLINFQSMNSISKRALPLLSKIG